MSEIINQLIKIMRITSKLWWAAKAGEKIPRKAKKAIFGNRVTKSQLRKMLNSVVIVRNEYPQSSDIYPYPFCPKCGCKHANWTGNMVSYPELYDKGYCSKCGFLVGMADNSPYVHALECKNDGYNLWI